MQSAQILYLDISILLTIALLVLVSHLGERLRHHGKKVPAKSKHLTA